MRTLPDVPTQKTLALIDASGFLYRAFFAIRGLSGPGGRPTNATYGFANMLRKLFSVRHPDAVAVVFDRREKTFRHDRDAAYKAHRAPMPDDLVPQIEDSKRLCVAMGLAVVEAPGFEADDLIATLAERAAKAGLRVEIVSSDKDLLQLVQDDAIAVWNPGQERLLNAASVRELFGVSPDHVVDVLALMGDASDNVPGVSGVGEKGARELVATHGSLEGIYASLASEAAGIKGRRRELLEAGRENAFLSRELVTVRRDAPVPGGDTAEALLKAFPYRPPGEAQLQALAQLYDELGLASLKRELRREAPSLFEEARQQGAQSPPQPALAEGALGKPPARWIASEAVLEFLSARIDGLTRVGLFIEAPPQGRVFPPPPIVAAVALPEETVAFEVDAAGTRALGLVFGASSLQIVAHDSKQILLAASALGLTAPGRLEDTMLAAYVLAPGLHEHDLSGDAFAFLGLTREALPGRRDLVGSGPLTPASLETEAGISYLEPRARLPLRLSDVLAARFLGEVGKNLRRVLDEIERPLVPVLAEMELAGIAVDRAVLGEMSRDFGLRLASLEKAIHEAAGEAFNVNSPQQLGRVLFDRLGYTAGHKTAKTKSYSTTSDVLEELASQELGPVPGLVLEWRELAKLKGTYVDALPAHIASDGRIHTRLDQAVAATGRLSSSEPNLQNIPIRTEVGRAIRRAFVAAPGKVLVTADYSQIELRLLAHFSKDAGLLEVFRAGEDIHRATAARVFGVAPELVSPDQRRGAKTINFGILYGMGPFALAGQLGVSRAAARSFIDAYFSRFPGIRACLDQILSSARETGYTTTLFGRTRPIPGLHDRNHAVRSNAERMAMNAPFQGTAADLIKLAMIRLHAALASRLPSARLILQVHDELVLECWERDAETAGSLARETMVGVAMLAVPLVVDVAYGPDWASAK